MTDDPRVAAILEAMARARAAADGKPDWNALMDHEQARYRAEAATSLSALLAVPGVVVTEDVGEMNTIGDNCEAGRFWNDKASGWNAYRAEMLANGAALLLMVINAVWDEYNAR